jgi:AcrR family transcriptional regulator
MLTAQSISAMPSDFYNLPNEKRALIEEVAIDEFAEHGFEGASISAMVSRAGIAKALLPVLRG